MQLCSNPSVSVIIPSYNHRNYIKTAIQSVLDQTFNDYELLIADDGSSDDSWSIITSFNDERILSYKFEENLGAAETVNFLIDKANGKYIALLNSDDYWHKDKLKVQYDFLEQNPNYAACFTNVTLVNERNMVLKNENPWSDIFKNSNSDSGKFLERLFFNLNSLCHPSIMIKKEIYSTVGLYNPCFMQLPDYDMWIRILKLAPLYIIDKELTFFRVITKAQNTSSMTFNNIQRQNLEIELILDSFFEDMSDKTFIDGFSEYFSKTGELSPEELKCERAFIYFKVNSKRKYVYKSVGIKKLYELLTYDKMAEVLHSSYGFTHKEFRKLENIRNYNLEKFLFNCKCIIKQNYFINRLLYKIKQRKDV